MKSLKYLIGLFPLIVGIVQGVEGGKFEAKIDAELLSEDETSLKTVMVHLKDGNHEKTEMKNRVLNVDFHEKSSLSLKFTEEARQARVGLVARSLQDAHAESQAGLLSMLEEHKSAKANGGVLEVQPLWISNTVILRNADRDLIQELATHPDVLYVEADKKYELYEPIERHDVSLKQSSMNYQWGVKDVDAPAQIAKGNDGKGIVVGVTDTGCTLEHEALRTNWRSENGWLDPLDASIKTPTDVQGHGTHCAGSILGTTNGIGVAPGAKWIGCRGCQERSCSGVALQTCGQFMFCPSGNNASCYAPHIVSNSWGSAFNIFAFNGSYHAIITAWQAAGIIPVFAIGNSGPVCRSTGNPGDHPDVFGIGATQEDRQVARFSSLGPVGISNRIKPDFVAPGADIVSAKFNTTDQYTKMSGTSMAAPHFAGVVALMMSDHMRRNNGAILTYTQIRNALIAGKAKHKALRGTIYPCGGIFETTYPNNYAGYGRVNATMAIAAL